MPSSKSVFISHISDDEAVAEWVKRTLLRDFLQLFDVFVSSDTESIDAGTEWFRSVHDALVRSDVLITLCSPASVSRPWINFEVGAAWSLKMPIIPVCYAGLKPSDLPIPLSLRQGLALEAPDGVKRLYEALARGCACATPQADFDKLAREVPKGHPETPSGRPTADEEMTIDRRLQSSLSTSKHRWRSLERLAIEAGVSEDTAARVLRDDDAVRFSKGKSGKTIVGLISRVGAA